MTLLLFVRHALTPQTGIRLSGWTPGLHLSEVGRAQASELPERLAGARLDAIYSSPLERCRETAAPLARAHGLRVGRNRGLGEVDYGDWTNRPLKQLMRTKLWPTIQQTPSAVRFPNGESILEVQTRIVSTAQRLAAAHPDQVVALFSHGDPIRLALAYLSGAPIDAFQRFIVSPASVSVVALDGGTPRILSLNATGDLRGLFPKDLGA